MFEAIDSVCLVISLAVPIVFAVTIWVMKMFEVNEDITDPILIWVIIEHMLIAKLLAVDLEKYRSSGGFISLFSFVPWVMALTLILNCLVAASLVYVVITPIKLAIVGG